MKIKHTLILGALVAATAAHAFPTGNVYSSTSGPNTCFTTLTGDPTARIVNNLNATLGERATARITPGSGQVREGREFLLATVDWFNGGGMATTANIQLGLTFRGGTSSGRQIGQGLVDFNMSWTGGNRGTRAVKVGTIAAGPVRSQIILGNEVYTLELTRAYSERVNYMQWGKAQVYGRLTQAVPEPTTMAALGLGGLALIRRTKKA